MDKNKPTLAIYGIQDIDDFETPHLVHDHALALFDQGHCLKSLQLERVTRNKRDNRLHRHLYALLKAQKLLAEPYDLIFVDHFVGRAFLSKQGNLRFEAPLSQNLVANIEPGICHWVGHSRQAYVLSHELAHVFSCLPFYGPFKENSLLVHFDGGASHSNFSAWYWHGGRLKLIEHHWDLKTLSSFFNANALNFAMLDATLADQHSVPGKLMGYAAHGQYCEDIATWLAENDYFQDHWKSLKVFFEQARNRFGYGHNRLILQEPFIQNIAATFQELFTQGVLAKIRAIQSIVQADYLYYTGGSALNIVTNTRLVREGLFQAIYVPPCTEDSGLALGAAAFMEYQKHGGIERCSPYLNNWGIESYAVVFDDAQIQAVANLLMQGKVLGVCNGFGEVGPRALGNRSIIALANDVDLTRRVSEEHKGREWYRPTAPVILKEDLSYFTGMEGVFPLSRYMLMEFSVLPRRRDEIAGVVHVNGTARIQTINGRDDNPFLFDLLSHMKCQYGIRALINTSFNYQGEPIVNSISDAEHSARRMRLDALVLNGKLRELA